jgi:hypothetical protein
MVQPKYSPTEALNKIKLMMNYDSSKTLSENQLTTKPLINEGGKDAAVRAILDRCSSSRVDLGNARMDVQDHIDMAALFDSAFSSALGTDNEAWRKALKKMSSEGVFEDLCAIAKEYEELAGEEFADGIDADIDFDNEYTEFTTAFQKMIKRGTQQSLKVKDAKSSDISYFEKTFPCIFQSNSNVGQGTELDQNKYIFIRVKGVSGKEFAVFSDGRIKTIATIGGQPDKQTGKKITCNGSKVAYIAESVVKKKSLNEQIDDSELTAIDTQDPGETKVEKEKTNVEKEKTNVKSDANSTTNKTAEGWKSDPTGNKTWEYQVRECKWIARKKGTTVEYPISDNSKYSSSVQKLETAYPELIAKCKDTNKDKPKVDTNIEKAEPEDPTTV